MTTTPSRGEVWLVRFDPQVAEEIAKVRPAVVLSVSSVGRLPLRIVVPITDWKPHYAGFPWFTELPSAPENGLTKLSGADAFQVKSVSLHRFQTKLGVLTPVQMSEIAAAVSLCIGFP